MATRSKEALGGGASLAVVLVTAGVLYLLSREAEASPGEFDVSNLVISPSVVNPGQPVTISCTVTNVGESAGTHTVTLGGDFVANQTITLEPGESRQVSFTVVPSIVKTYNVSVDGLSGSFEATEEPTADIVLSNLVVSPAECSVGEVVTITVTATNVGEAIGSKVVTCNVI